MKYKPIYYYSDADQCFVAMCPELPGCMADGETISEALSNLEVAMSDWMQVYHERTNAEPTALSDLDVIRTNPDSKAVAAYILEKTGKISTYALQKMLYYCQAWAYGWSGQPLFEGEFQAWVDGPVNPTVFHMCRGRRFVSSNDIDSQAHTFSAYEERLIDLVLSVYDEFDGDELSQMTHEEAPWVKGRQGRKPEQYGNTPIQPEDMIRYYGQHTGSSDVRY